MSRLDTLSVIGLCALALSGCDKTGAYGEANSIIVGAPMELWEAVGDGLIEGLEPTIFTVRDERTFKITHQDPLGPEWDLLREFKQVLLIGSVDDPWIAEALEERPRPEAHDPPEIFQLFDVWARGQLVTVLLVPPGGGAADVASQLDELHELLDRQYRQFVLARMFVSGHDSLLIDTLLAQGGFSLDLPRVYRWDRRDSVFIFRNDNPDPAELIREVGVTWRTPIPEGMDREGILEWRLRIAREYYTDEQVVEEEIEGGPGGIGDRLAYQIQGVWQNPPGAWPAGGPFLARTISCPQQDRLYLLDSWLYAPGRDKYEYMLQLQTVLNSFECEGASEG